MSLYNLFPEIYRVYDEKSGEVLRHLFEAFEASVEKTKREVEDFPELADAESCPEKFLPYLLGNLANPFPTSLIDFSKKQYGKWMLGQSVMGTITDERGVLGVILDPAAVRDLIPQLFQLYKRKGTKQGIIWACRAVAKTDVFIADYWTDGAASLRHGTDDIWRLGDGERGIISEEDIFNDPPYCEICFGDANHDYPEGFGVLSSEDERLGATISLYDDYFIYEGLVIFKVIMDSEIPMSADLLIQYSETGGFTWQTARGWLSAAPMLQRDLWTIGERVSGICNRVEFRGMARGLTPGVYYFIFDPEKSNMREIGKRSVKFRAVPILVDKRLGRSSVTNVFQYKYGDDPKDVIDTDLIPAYISESPFFRQRLLLGGDSKLPSAIWEANLDIINRQRRPQPHFEVIIISAANDMQKAMIREIIDYMKPAQTHYEMICGDEHAAATNTWTIGTSQYGLI